MRANLATADVLTSVHTAADLGPCVRAINEATSHGNANDARDGLAAFQKYLLHLTDKERSEQEGAILDAFHAFAFNRGVRATSWLQVHASDAWSRQYWAAIEDILEDAL